MEMLSSKADYVIKAIHLDYTFLRLLRGQKFGDASDFTIRIGSTSGPSGSKWRVAAEHHLSMNPITH
jgi:hypothetical protein